MGSIANSTVLARKWRPKQFSELVGQSHVMQALSNALDQQRLHHAYLFTGTRGVGKTTIARIFSKALNCEQGISSTPCGECEVCRSIDEGRFIDLIEVDAASRTKVDDTREILDNVQFAPTQGRYKVYLIDEVHMLSKSSFNALLKTLEEPPEHVKFLFATTDPHKLPVTVLSRCLQFNLMRLTQPQLEAHLEFIMNQEGLSFDKSALGLIAKAADGSVRDALSLLDQAIAYGAGKVMFEPVQTMLGWVDQQYSVTLLKALARDDAQQLKEVIQKLAIMGVDYQALLAQLIEVLHALSYAQVLEDKGVLTTIPETIVCELASQISPERVQLLYQIALLAKRDIVLAPDIRIGFEMALIRMLAFQPVSSSDCVSVSASEGGSGKPVQEKENISSACSAVEGLASARSLMATMHSVDVNSTTTTPPSLENCEQEKKGEDRAQSEHFQNLRTRLKQSLGKSLPDALEAKAPTKLKVSSNNSFQKSQTSVITPSTLEKREPKSERSMNHMAKEQEFILSDCSGGTIESWLALIDKLALKGMAAEVARNSVLIHLSETRLAISVDPEQNYSRQALALEQFEQAVKRCFGDDFVLEFVEADVHFTPVKYEKHQVEIKQSAAQTSIQQDPVVQALTQTLGLEVVVESIRPI